MNFIFCKLKKPQKTWILFFTSLKTSKNQKKLLVFDTNIILFIETREIELKDRQTEIRSLLQNFRWGGDSDSSVDDSSTRTGTKKSRSSRGFSLKPMPTKPTTGEAYILDTWLPAVLFPKPATKSYNAGIMDLVGLHLFASLKNLKKHEFQFLQA